MSGRSVRPTSYRMLLALLLLAGAAAACSRSDEAQRDGSGRITEAGPVSVFELQPGDCLPLTDAEEEAAEVSTVQAVPCGEPHSREVFAVLDYGEEGGEDRGGAFPGPDALASFADAACADRFADYVGIDYLDSSLFITYLLPNLEGWDKGSDRDVICLVTTTGATFTGSAEGSAR